MCVWVFMNISVLPSGDKSYFSLSPQGSNSIDTDFFSVVWPIRVALFFPRNYRFQCRFKIIK